MKSVCCNQTVRLKRKEVEQEVEKPQTGNRFIMSGFQLKLLGNGSDHSHLLKFSLMNE